MLIVEGGKVKDMDNPYVNYAREELERTGFLKKGNDEASKMKNKIADTILQLAQVYGDSHLQGELAALVITAFTQTTQFMPFTPLTGEADEWEEIKPGVYQNKRYKAMYKDDNGVYDTEHYVFVRKNGIVSTAAASAVRIKQFPYMPHTVYIYEGSPEAEQFKEVFDKNAQIIQSE